MPMPKPKTPPAPRREKATKQGRPSGYTPEIADSICDHIAKGKSLVGWCNTEGNAGYSTVMRWLEAHEDFREKYARARADQADFLAEEILQIADDGLNDTYTDEEGNVRTNQDVIARSRLRVDSRKWYASKLLPKKYGDRVQQEVSGPDGGPVQVTDPARPKLTREEWLAAHGVKVP